MLLNPRVPAPPPSPGAVIPLHATGNEAQLDVVVFGRGSEFIAAVMEGLMPAIEGEAGVNPEVAMRKLFLTTCELLKEYLPKVGEHHRNVPEGGVYKVDRISKLWTKTS
jgi:hypothetical protein